MSACVRLCVALGDDGGWSIYGAERSQPVATGGKWVGPENGSNKPKTVAVGCDQLPIGAHGKEGIDGSSPSEGFRLLPANRLFALSLQQKSVTRGPLRAHSNVRTPFARKPTSASLSRPR
jgi:hypothetical protein